VSARGVCVLMEVVKAGRNEARVEDAVRRAVALGAARARARKECMLAILLNRYADERWFGKGLGVVRQSCNGLKQLVMQMFDGDVFLVT
jgi:hypothetical protein